MLYKDDLNRLFRTKHRISTPDETIDGEPDERLAIMEGFANLLECSQWLIYRVAVEFGVRRPRGAGTPARRKEPQ